jgi:D-alanyl-D-alanine carboxypeptidase/D-alanyl-D-alanine-endopeptidase (penicillin-binding protein 4)
MSDHFEKHLRRRAVLAGLLSSAAGMAFAGAPQTSLRPLPRPSGLTRPEAGGPSFESIINNADLSGEKSIVLIDLDSGRLLEAESPSRALPPASVTKVVTTLYGLRKLGATHRFTTRVLATGPIEDGIVQGDLVLMGAGDPHLDSDSFGDLVEQLVARGITGVTRGFKIYDGALPFIAQIDDKQPEYVGYNPSLSGLILNFNRVYFEWKRGKDGFDLSMSATGARFKPQIESISVAVADRDTPVFAHSQDGSGEGWTVRRASLGKGGGRWLPVRRPFDYADEAFRLIAADKGVKLPKAKRSGQVSGTLVAAVQSSQLRDMLRSMLRFSTNITAEAVGLAASSRSGTAPESLADSGTRMTNWARESFGVQTAHFVDHSGLGDASRASARDMVSVLAKDGWHGGLRPLLKDVKLTDERGRRAEIPGAMVEAKTGTLNFASALAGFITCPNGRALAFAIFTADVAKRDAIPMNQRERPPGGRTWLRKSRRMQQALMRRWIGVYGT